MAFKPETPYLAVDGIINVQNEKGEFVGIAVSYTHLTLPTKA